MRSITITYKDIVQQMDKHITEVKGNPNWGGVVERFQKDILGGSITFWYPESDTGATEKLNEKELKILDQMFKVVLEKVLMLFLQVSAMRILPSALKLMNTKLIEVSKAIYQSALISVLRRNKKGESK